MAALIAGKMVVPKANLKKVVCFGDSITYGAGMKGAGTATGETYPAHLKKFLERKFAKP